MRAAGMKQPVFGSSRAAYAETVAIAGDAADGFVAVSPVDLSRSDPPWMEFRRRYRTRYNADPDAYAAYAYDGMNLVIAAVEKGGLNRGKVMDVFREYVNKTYDGVAGTARFDATLNNIAPLGLARVEGGRFVYWDLHGDATSVAND
jgi:branched-chain amino acid transport system substrate-binding protein